MNASIIRAAAMVMATSAASAAAPSPGLYTGAWTIALTHYEYPTSQGMKRGPDVTHCVVLTDLGIYGWPHSGIVELDNQSGGMFQVINGTMQIVVGAIGSGYEPASWVFTAAAKGGKLTAKGTFEYVRGDESYGAANATFTPAKTC
jgi:hypothetical protein